MERKSRASDRELIVGERINPEKRPPLGDYATARSVC